MKQYKNPPVKEAIFSFSFKEPIGSEKLDSFSNTSIIKQLFPTRENLQSIEINFSNEKLISSNTPPVNHYMDGYRLKNDNSVIIIKSTQLSYHSINNYKGWDFVLSNLNNILKELFEIIGQYSISQITTRYINQIGIPANFENISEFISLVPNVPKELNPINNFFLQINTKDINGLIGTVTETILPKKSQENKINVLIDITVIKNLQDDSYDIWETFKLIRTFKNKLFQNCITSKTENLFNL